MQTKNTCNDNTLVNDDHSFEFYSYKEFNDSDI